MHPNEDDTILALDVVEKYVKKINELFDSVDEKDRKVIAKGLTDDGNILKARVSFIYQVIAEIVTKETTRVFAKKEWRKLISGFKDGVDLRLKIIEEE